MTDADFEAGRAIWLIHVRKTVAESIARRIIEKWRKIQGGSAMTWPLAQDAVQRMANLSLNAVIEEVPEAQAVLPIEWAPQKEEETA